MDHCIDHYVDRVRQTYTGRHTFAFLLYDNITEFYYLNDYNDESLYNLISFEFTTLIDLIASQYMDRVWIGSCMKHVYIMY